MVCSPWVCVSKDVHFKVNGLNGDKLNVCLSKCQPCNEPVTCPLLSLGKDQWWLTESPLGRSVLHYFLLLNGKAPGQQLVCHVHMAQNVRGCWRSQITSEVQFGVYRKTQCSSNTNWIAAECGPLKLTMQYLGD